RMNMMISYQELVRTFLSEKQMVVPCNNIWREFKEEYSYFFIVLISVCAISGVLHASLTLYS
ncbi:hypothetical protein, partial [Citrobacter gillenii]|uniref:hypothetical protein n=1 Tax=Citrobacter gillenii TaxID=67828 RepID=UPI0022E531BA